MTTIKIAVAQQMQGIQRFFLFSTVKDGIIAITEKNDNVFYMFSRNNKICFWDFLPKGIETLEFLIHGKYSTADCIWQEKAFFRF